MYKIMNAYMSKVQLQTGPELQKTTLISCQSQIV